MPWHGHLDLRYERPAAAAAAADQPPAATTLHHRHDGPLRILKSLYPEGPAVCHNVIVHPPGGLVGGDQLDIRLDLAPGTHALLTTPGATRYYRSLGDEAEQRVQARVASGARLEWLPLETLVHSGALASSRLQFELADGAEMFGADVVALGLPAAGEAFERGHWRHEIRLPGRWLDRGRTAAEDLALLDGPTGWAGHRVLGSLFFATGGSLTTARSDALLEAARAVIEAHPLAARAGVSASHEGLVLLRVLGDRVEPVFGLIAAVWQAWRPLAWGLPAITPRVWRT